MKRAHTITLSVFSKPEDNAQKDKEALLSLIPFDVDDEKIKINVSSASSFNERTITICEVRLQKERHTNSFLDFLSENLSGAQKQQLREQDNRVDDNCDGFLRFDKHHLPKFVLTDGGACVHVKMALAAFPKKRAVALQLFKELFS